MMNLPPAPLPPTETPEVTLDVAATGTNPGTGSVPEHGHSLSFDQVQRLCSVLTEPVTLPPKDPGSNFPVLHISPAAIVKVVRQRLIRKGITIRGIRMNGSAASYCLCENHADSSLPELKFNDVDLIFGVSIDERCRERDFHIIKEEVLTSLLDFFPEESSKARISGHLLEETYTRKMVLVMTPKIEWSLFSLGDETGTRSIELKFVNKIQRQFEFTVDSFQICLDEYFTYGRCMEESPVAISAQFFPTVHAISVYPDYEEAMKHLNERLIHTQNPEEIRGGGLLKYCTLLVNGFKPAESSLMAKLEAYMCSRFFIDFPTDFQQYYKIRLCVTTRFLSVRELGKCQEFLKILFTVVGSQARCLMESERQKTMSVILHISFEVGQPFPPPMAMFSSYPIHPPPCVPLRIQTSYHHHGNGRSNHPRNRRHFTPPFESSSNQHHPHHHNHSSHHRALWSMVKRTPAAEVR
jgi:hypothetical protein